MYPIPMDLIERLSSLLRARITDTDDAKTLVALAEKLKVAAKLYNEVHATFVKGTRWKTRSEFVPFLGQLMAPEIVLGQAVEKPAAIIMEDFDDAALADYNETLDIIINYSQRRLNTVERKRRARC